MCGGGTVGAAGTGAGVPKNDSSWKKGEVYTVGARVRAAAMWRDGASRGEGLGKGCRRGGASFTVGLSCKVGGI